MSVVKISQPLPFCWVPNGPPYEEIDVLMMAMTLLPGRGCPPFTATSRLARSCLSR
jgi:hypothetical protein